MKKVRNEVNALMNEFASLKTSEQEAEFKQKMDVLLNSKTDEERTEFGKAMVRGAHQVMKEADELINRFNC